MARHGHEWSTAPETVVSWYEDPFRFRVEIYARAHVDVVTRVFTIANDFRSWQHVMFKSCIVTFIKIVGVQNTANEVTMSFIINILSSYQLLSIN